MDKRDDEKAWYYDDEDKFYEESVGRIREAVAEKGSPFEEAVAALGIGDEKLRSAIEDDALKVLIAELHFMGKKPLEDLARSFRLPAKRLKKAREEMVADIKQAAIDAYKSSLGQGGNA
ncbi:MAG: hypothetical protein Kow0025_26200 [Thermodesulfovibrionales bacterium]